MDSGFGCWVAGYDGACGCQQEKESVKVVRRLYVWHVWGELEKSVDSVLAVRRSGFGVAFAMMSLIMGRALLPVV